MNCRKIVILLEVSWQTIFSKLLIFLLIAIFTRILTTQFKIPQAIPTGPLLNTLSDDFKKPTSDTNIEQNRTSAAYQTMLAQVFNAGLD